MEIFTGYRLVHRGDIDVIGVNPVDSIDADKTGTARLEKTDRWKKF